MAVDIKGMTRKELNALKARVDKALEKLEKVDKKKALEAAQAAARQHGFNLSDLGAIGGKAKSAKANPAKAGAPKYRHPENSSITWTGKGRRPDWIKDGLANGKSLGDFAIK